MVSLAAPEVTPNCVMVSNHLHFENLGGTHKDSSQGKTDSQFV
jgi:hypothetical protein